MSILLSILASIGIISATGSLVISNTKTERANLKLLNNKQSSRFSLTSNDLYPKFCSSKIQSEFNLLPTLFKKLFPSTNEAIKIVRVLNIPDKVGVYIVVTAGYANDHLDIEHEMDMWGYIPSNTKNPLVFLNQVSKGMSTNNSYFAQLTDNNLQILKMNASDENATYTLSFNFRPIVLPANPKAVYKIKTIFSLDQNNQFVTKINSENQQSSINDFSVSSTVPGTELAQKNLFSNDSEAKPISFFVPNDNFKSTSISKTALYFWIYDGGNLNLQNNNYKLTNGGSFSLVTNSQDGSESISSSVYKFDSTGGTASLTYSKDTIANHPTWISNYTTSVLSKHSNDNYIYTLRPDSNNQIFYSRINLINQIIHEREVFTNVSQSPISKDINPIWETKMLNSDVNGNSTYLFYNETTTANVTDHKLYYSLNLKPDSNVPNLKSINLKNLISDFDSSSNSNVPIIWDDNNINAKNNNTISFLISYKSSKTKKLITEIINLKLSNSTSSINDSPEVESKFILDSNLNINTNEVSSFYHNSKTKADSDSAEQYFITRKIPAQGNSTSKYEADQISVQEDRSVVIKQLETSSEPILGNIINLSPDNINSDPGLSYFLSYNYINIASNIFSLSPLIVDANLEVINPIINLESKFKKVLPSNIKGIKFNFNLNSDILQNEVPTFIKDINAIDPTQFLKYNPSLILGKEFINALGFETNTLLEQTNLKGYDKFITKDLVLTNSLALYDKFLNSDVDNIVLNIDSISELNKPNLASVLSYNVETSQKPTYFDDDIKQQILSTLNKTPSTLWNNTPNLKYNLPNLISNKYKSYAQELQSTSIRAHFKVNFEINSNYNFTNLVNAANMANFIGYVSDHLSNIDVKEALLNLNKYDSNFKVNYSPITIKNDGISLNTKIALQNKLQTKFNLESAKRFVGSAEFHPKKINWILIIEIAVPTVVLILGLIGLILIIKLKLKKQKKSSIGTFMPKVATVMLKNS